MNILIVKLSAIGDVIHTLPALAGLRDLYPGAHITWVVEESASGLLKNHPYLDSLLISRRKQWSKDLRSGRLIAAGRDIRSFLKTLRSRPYDLVIDFHGLFKSSMLVFLSRGKRKLGYDSLQELSGLFLTEKIYEDMTKHAVDRYLDFLSYLGAENQPARFVLPRDKAAEDSVRNLLKMHHLEDKHYIAVNPVALWETKLWSDEKFAQLGDRIAGELGFKVVFTGAAKEPLEKITSLMLKDGVNLGGRTSLSELAVLYEKARMVVSTDSGPMHLAAATGTPVVALFGPTDPARTGPYGSGHTVIRTTRKCSPCFLKKCRTTQCMSDISVDQVFESVKKCIKE